MVSRSDHPTSLFGDGGYRGAWPFGFDVRPSATCTFAYSFTSAASLTSFLGLDTEGRYTLNFDPFPTPCMRPVVQSEHAAPDL